MPALISQRDRPVRDKYQARGKCICRRLRCANGFDGRSRRDGFIFIGASYLGGLDKSHPSGDVRPEISGLAGPRLAGRLDYANKRPSRNNNSSLAIPALEFRADLLAECKNSGRLGFGPSGAFRRSMFALAFCFPRGLPLAGRKAAKSEPSPSSQGSRLIGARVPQPPARRGEDPLGRQKVKLNSPNENPKSKSARPTKPIVAPLGRNRRHHLHDHQAPNWMIIINTDGRPG